METLQDAVRTILTQPSPQALVAVQGMLLVRSDGEAAIAPALELAGRFFEYLSELQSKLTARQYSELASRLDIGAVGTVALDNILFAQEEHRWPSLLLGALGEGLMVAASRQYIKGWEVELRAVHARATWYLAESLWRAAREMQPDLPAEERWQAIHSLLAPVYEDQISPSAQSLLLGHIYQVLLAIYLLRLDA